MPRLIAGLLTLLIGLAGISPVLGIPLPSTPYVHDGAGREVSRSWQRSTAQGQTVAPSAPTTTPPTGSPPA